MPYQIVLADDHILFREGVKKILEELPEIQIMAEVGDGQALLQLLQNTVPDLIILDITMPNLQGIEATRKIKGLYPGVKILILTMHKSKEYLHRAISAGADGYLLKENASRDLVAAIETIRDDNTYISPIVYGHIVDFFHKQPQDQESAPRSPALSKREQMVLALIAEGNTGKEIAAKLEIAHATVQGHRANIKKKLNIKKHADLIKYAIQKGYTSTEIV